MKTEADVKKKLKEALKKVPRFWYFMPMQNGMGVAGIPDFIGCYRGQFVAIETKRPGRRGEANGGLSALQVRIRDLIVEAGGKYLTIDDQETIDDFMFWVDCIEDAIKEAENAEL